MKDIKKEDYMDSVHKSGRIWNLTMLAVMLLFPIAAALVFKAVPDWHGLLLGLISTFPMYAAVGVVEVITYIPMLGAGGSYLSFVTGNISNLKLPCALNSLEQAGVKANSEEGNPNHPVGCDSYCSAYANTEFPRACPSLCPDSSGIIRWIGCRIHLQKLEDIHCTDHSDAGTVHLHSGYERRHRGHYGSGRRGVYPDCITHHV